MSKTYFDQLAPQWDEMRQSFFTEAIREKALSIARVQVGAIAADIGAGTGFITEGLISQGLRVIAVDQSEKMVAEMRKKFATAPVDYRIGEGESLPIADAHVDYAFANMYLHHVERPAQAIKEIVRILKVGGRLVITDLVEHALWARSVAQHDRWMGFASDAVAHWLRDAGLGEVVVEASGETCCRGADIAQGTYGIPIFIAHGTK